MTTISYEEALAIVDAHNIDAQRREYIRQGDDFALYFLDRYTEEELEELGWYRYEGNSRYPWVTRDKAKLKRLMRRLGIIR